MTVVVQEDVAALVRELGVEEVVHFTRNCGLLGIAAEGAVLARKHLDRSQYLKHIYRPNAKLRRDVEQLDYVNLSIGRVNASLLDIAMNKWYRDEEDLFWCVLAFSPEILSHNGVLFVTTNNMYTGAVRAPGAAGLRALYEPAVEQWTGKIVRRRPETERAWPTCRQAEALYPDALSVKYLTKIYLRDEADGDEAHGVLKTFGLNRIPLVIDASMFK
ncbi:MAG TPA: DarT ssDNA thymidine ADP-ribosyltransferase family protein [Candidatus Elarobacter sp.]|jgi:hypothetical protein|nr:DarT ssDNA thymidine ADP-ribosyltransferase family protein [Candidatus Elarobacter sp.]